MRLVGQRVRQPTTGNVAIHGFYYVHGPAMVWSGYAPEGIGSGVLEATSLELKPAGGNHVLSYLDIICPDETPPDEIERTFDFLMALELPPPPWGEAIGRCTFEANIVPRWRHAWRLELPQLFNVAQNTRVGIV